ncbi:hypothetical protein Tco_1145229 [Tanacetum coccineum]
MAQQPMRNEKELCPTNVRLPPNKSNVRIDPDETQDEPLYDISLEILKNNTIYNALTLTTEVLVIYMRQFWHTGVVKAENVDFAELLWEDFRFQINKHKNLVTKHETIPYPRFTKLIIRHILSQNPKLNKRLDSTPHLIADEVRLEKLKYAPKGECKPTFGMPIPEAILSGGIKETQVYADYVTKYPQAQTAPKHGIGKSLMRRGAVPTPKKKKDDALKYSRSITAEDNVLSYLDEAFEYAKKVSIDETETQEKERQTKHRHAGIMLERQVNKEVDEGYEHLKVKLKTKQQPSPEAMLLLNLKKQGKESKKQVILKEIKRKDIGEGSSAAPESPDHSSSSDDFFESATDHDKIESERESESDNDSEHGDESDKSTSDEESTKSDKSDNDSDNVDDQTEELMIKPLNKEPEQPPKSLPTQAPNRANAIEESVHANVLNEVRNQLPKILLKAIFDALKKTLVNLSQPTPTPSVDPSKYELKYQLTHDDQDPEDHEGRKVRREGEKVLDDEQVHEGHKFQAKEIPGKHNPVWFQKTVEERPVQSWFNELVDAEEEPEKHEYKDGSVTLFGKLVKKIFKKEKITKEDVDGPSFELLKGTCKNSIELEYNMDQCSLALTDIIDWINPEGDRYHQDLSKPLPLTGPLGKKRSLVNYFFNQDLEYLVKGSKERTHALSVTKIKASIKVDKQYGYAYLEEIVVTRTDKKEYMFCEADFPYLNQNDIKDLYLLEIQNKIRNIKGTEEYDLINALKMYIGVIVIKKRVEDVQMGVESYQTKLNLTKPQLMEGCLHQLGYDNEGMEKYTWTKEDEKKTKKFMDKIENTLKE